MSRRERVEHALAARRPLVDEALAAAVDEDEPERLYDASRHLLEAGGKRLRPAMLLLAADALADDALADRRPDESAASLSATRYREFPDRDGDPVDVLGTAVSIELVQSFTLIHDDIMDDDDVRRGVPAVHRAYDDSMAILAGDTLYARAFELLLSAGGPPERSLEALSVLARTCTEICEGQAVDIAFETREAVSVESYLEMVESKTAVLFAAASSLPAVVLGYEAHVEPLAAYGRAVGRAFQIHDDLLDLTTPTEVLGKQRGSDLVEGKRTLVTAHAREQGIDVDGLVGSDPTEAAIEAAVERLEDAGSLAYARETAREHVARGHDHLDALPENESRRLLADIAEYLVEREY